MLKEYLQSLEYHRV
ncbi:hypothetical protein EC950183_4989, partial [Escherichia coli 95.0183]